MKSFAVATLAACASAATSDHWAVIMAGSNTYGNYRHQADSHHAVKIMLENGIPRENIIHLAYDDIANNTYVDDLTARWSTRSRRSLRQ